MSIDIYSKIEYNILDSQAFVFRCESFVLDIFCFEREEKMEENILIKSEMHKGIKRFLQIAPLAFFGVAVLLAIILSTDFEYVTSWGWRRSKMGWELAFEFNNSTATTCFMMFILASLSLIAGIVTGIMYLATRKCELILTEKNVKGKTVFGKEVVLPLYMVSAYSTRKFLSTITVATSSGITKFALIRNYKEIGSALSQKINERQENTASATVVSAPIVQQSSAMDELKKLKDLLDAGIITQEEFEAKKKQLLGL